MSIRSIPRAALLASTLLASTSIPALADDVTSQRLMNPDKEPQNWLMVNKDYSAHRYSELDLINKDNVKNLHLAFTVAVGGVSGPRGSTRVGAVIKARRLSMMASCMSLMVGAPCIRIDVRDPATAKFTWVMDPGVNKADMFVPSNRGVALYKNFVVSVTGDCKVLWTKADTGELVKTVQFDDMKTSHCALTSAPLVDRRQADRRRQRR